MFLSEGVYKPYTWSVSENSVDAWCLADENVESIPFSTAFGLAVLSLGQNPPDFAPMTKYHLVIDRFAREVRVDHCVLALMYYIVM